MLIRIEGLIFLTNNTGRDSMISSTLLFVGILGKIKGSSLYTNAFYLILNSAVTSLLGFVFWNIMARFFPPGEVGIGSALVAASMLLGALANLGLGAGLTRFLPEAGENRNRLLNASFTLSGIIAAGGSLFYLAGTDYWSPALVFVRGNILLLGFFVIFTAATALSALIDQALVAGRSARYVFWRNTVISLTKLPLPVLAFSQLNGYGIFAGTGAAVAAGVLLAWFMFLPSVYRGYRLRPAQAGYVVKQMLPYSLGNYMANLLNSTPGLIYPLLVLNLLGPEMSAYFYIAWMMTMVLAVIPSGMAQSLFAEGSHDQHELAPNGRRALVLALLLSLPAVGAMALLGGWLLHFFGPGYAENGAVTMRYLALAVIPQCVNVLYMTVNQVKKKVHLVVVQTGVLSAISLGAGYWLLGKFGLNGTGMAYALAHFIVAAVVVWPLLRALRVK
jgi:O-antigen/teichoic acid export membrane protein